MASIAAPEPTEDYKRLQMIEQKVIACIQIAAQVTEHFSRVGRTAELAGPVQQLCTNFMNTIAVRQKPCAQGVKMFLEEALALVREGAEATPSEHPRLELHAYHGLARAHINTEKLQVLRMHLEAMATGLREAAEAEGAGQEAGGMRAEGAAGAGAGELVINNGGTGTAAGTARMGAGPGGGGGSAGGPGSLGLDQGRSGNAGVSPMEI